MRRLIYLVILAVFLLIPFHAHAWPGVVVRVVDGDSLIVRNENGAEVTLRLDGIDCPEGPGSIWEAQPYSRRATDFVKAMLPNGSAVVIFDRGKDGHGRTLAGVISFPEGKVVQEELLKAGLTMVYEEYCKNCTYYLDLQEEAKREKRGLWAWRGDFIPPWDWRNAAREKAAQAKQNQ